MHTIGRFAPSPSGRMHLGNVLCALLAWLSARQQNGEFLLRIEDLDEMRCPRSFADLIIDDLRWLGLDWDGEIPYQSERTAVYEKYEAILREKGLLYPCFCSRAALHAASAPHLSDGRGGLRRNLPRFNTRASGRKAQKACACNARARARAHHHIHGRRVRRVYRNAHRGVRRLHHPAVGRRVRVSAGGRGG